MKPQVKPNHYFANTYDSKERFISYWYQINEIVNLRPKKVLEIGVGNGFVSKYLKERRINVLTLDIDKKLNSDIVGSVLDIPFPDNSFEVVACYELLEHIEYKNFNKALSEIFRVSNSYAILSLPDANRVYRVYVHFPKVGIFKKLIPLPRFKKPVHNFDGEHYWEIGKAKYPLQRIINDIRKTGFKIEKTYRVFENPYHRFFILEKNAKSSFEEITSDGAWCWFADPRAVYYEGKYKKTYMGWITSKGVVKVASYNHKTGNVIESDLKKLHYDDHANPALLVLQDGRIAAFYSKHTGHQMFYRISENPEDISSWGAEMTISTNTPGNYGYTYPNPIRLNSEANKIYLFWRGGNFKPTFSTSEDCKTWSKAKTLIDNDNQRPYVKYISDGKSKIHFAFTDGHPNETKNNNIYYIYYRNGSFYKADDSKIKDLEELPLLPLETDKLYDSNSNNAKAWIWDIALDSSGYPVVVYATFPAKNDHVYWYTRWNGELWKNYQITSAGKWFPNTQWWKTEREPYYSGGITLDHANPSIVYLSREIHGVHEIEKWTTPDDGLTWTSERITSGSEDDNVRPVVPRGTKPGNIELIWMNGDYRHYTQYKTSLRMYQQQD